MPPTAADIQRHLDSLAKPPGSLGRLEALAARLCEVQGTLRPQTKRRRAVLFAADHGVVAAGVSAWPQSVTRSVVKAVRDGVAASAVLARATGTELRVIDVGTVGPELPPGEGFASRRVREGTRDLSRGAALTTGECVAAWSVGVEEAAAAADAGAVLVVPGEMGIGNTTAASVLTALVTGREADAVVGPGAGADPAALARKREVVRAAVRRYRPRLGDDTAAFLMSAVSGLELVAMAGFMSEAAARGRTILLDGFVATAAALLTGPEVHANMIAAHLSPEPGHAVALRHLGLTPLLDNWGMRLGEGTGALVALPLLDAAAAICSEMATLADLGATPS